MTPEERQQLRAFEAKVQQALQALTRLRSEREGLAAQCEALQDRLEQQRARAAELSESLERLRLARLLEVSADDLPSARRRLSSLIHDVDKCIALLGGY